MILPRNILKAGCAAGDRQIGFWNSIAAPIVTEALAGCGFDWILLDTEHSPTDLSDTLGMMQAMAPYPVSAAVRVAGNDTVLIKRALDLGAQTLMVPCVQSAEDARHAVAAMRYAPRGVRGVGGSVRASRYGAIADYVQTAESELCLIVQIETAAGLAQIEAIAAVDGVDCLFIGPNDLAASLGFPGRPSHPDVVAAIHAAIRRIVAAGKPAGILSVDDTFTRACLASGATIVAVGVDLPVLLTRARGLAVQFQQAAKADVRG